MITWLRCLRQYADTVAAISALGVLVTSIVGLMLVQGELEQLRRQNAYLEQTVRQTYRPLGVVSYSKSLEEEANPNIRVAQGTSLGTFSYFEESYIHNDGAGVLSYLGVLTYFSANQIDFRKNILSGILDTIIFDGRLPYSRRKPIRPGQFQLVKVHGENLQLKSKYYVYTLFLYEDQDGALYDTERLEYMEFDNSPKVTEHGLVPIANSIFETEKYHQYNGSEKENLVRFISKYKHPLADVISAGS